MALAMCPIVDDLTNNRIRPGETADMQLARAAYMALLQRGGK